MNVIIKRIENNKREFRSLYKQGVLGYESDNVVHLQLSLFKKIHLEYRSDVKIVDYGEEGDYPIRLEMVIDDNLFFSIMNLEEYMELTFNE